MKTWEDRTDYWHFCPFVLWIAEALTDRQYILSDLLDIESSAGLMALE